MNSFTIIGGGIIGLSIANEIVLRNLGKVEIIEKETNLGTHASGRNSGVIHSGINQKPNSLKAKLCLDGSRLLRKYCSDKEIPFEECGTIVVANSQDEIKRLKELYILAKEVGVPETRLISKKELSEREPYARGIEALFSPTGAIVDSNALLRQLSTDALEKGVEIKVGERVIDIGEKKVITDKQDYHPDLIINCAGLYADILAHKMGVGNDLSIIPFRGDYLKVPARINGMVYPVPDLRFPFLGTHLTKSIDGVVLAGPTATISLAGREGYDGGINLKFLSETANNQNFWRWLLNAGTSPSTLQQIVHNLKNSISKKSFIKDIQEIYSGEIDGSEITKYRSGIRAQLVNARGKLVDDFVIERTPSSIHILNAVSPGLTSSLAFARYVVDNYIT